MGELHDAVTALLDAFARGISAIRVQRERRKEERGPVDATQAAAETHLRKSLKKSRSDVKEAYGRDLARHGPRFASGDAQAHSALTLILLRLDAAFASAIQRFTKGKSTRTDYHTLMSLSNASRLEAIHTFEQLSTRLPPSSLSLTPSRAPPSQDRRAQERKAKPAGEHQHHHRRPRSSSSRSAPPRVRVREIAAADLPHPRPAPHALPSATPRKAKPPSTRSSSSPSGRHRSTTNTRKPKSPPRSGPPPPAASRTRSRRSWKSDSTKLGEIPEHQWAASRPGELRVVYPLGSAQPTPEKSRSRFMRFLRK